MGTAKVAVITPTYNHARFISACIDSVLAQTYPHWEMVIVDDGSTDATLLDANAYADPRIQVLTGVHRGLPALGEVYQRALQQTNAPLIAVLEGDDTWPRDKLARQVTHFDDPSIVLAYGAAGLIDSEGCVYAIYNRHPKGPAAENTPVGAILPYLLEQNFIPAPTVMLRRSALEASGGFWQPPSVPYVDHPTWLRLSLRGRFSYDPSVVGYWRRHPAQFTTSRATGAQPDNRAFLTQVMTEAASIGLLGDRLEVASRIADSPTRHAAWANASLFRLALLHGTVRDGIRSARPLLATRSPKWVALASIGLASRLAGSDLEWVFRTTNRFSWPPRRHTRGHRRVSQPQP